MLATMTMPGTFWFYSAVALVGAIILYFILPETEGRTLMDIERHFVGGAPLLPSHPVTPTTARVAARTFHQAGNGARYQDHVVSKTPTNGALDTNKGNGKRMFQKHLDEHRIRLDGHRHNHAFEGADGEKNSVGSDFTQSRWRQEIQPKQQQHMMHVAVVSEMTHF